MPELQHLLGFFRRCGAGFEELKVGSGNYSHNIIKSEFMDSI